MTNDLTLHQGHPQGAGKIKEVRGTKLYTETCRTSTTQLQPAIYLLAHLSHHDASALYIQTLAYSALQSMELSAVYRLKNKKRQGKAKQITQPWGTIRSQYRGVHHYENSHPLKISPIESNPLGKPIYLYPFL